MSITTIVVAVSFEDDSQKVAQRAIQLANQHHAQLIGVHVMESLPEQEANSPPAFNAAALTNLVYEQSSAQLRTLLARTDRPAIIRLETGRPYEAIQRIATSCHADLLVIGPGVAKNLREKVFGSTADRLVRAAPCPVLIVRKEVRGSYSHITVGVDCSEYSRAAAHWSARLSPNASRRLIHAFQVPLSFEQAMLKAGTAQSDIDLYRRARGATARRQIMDIFAEQGELPKGVQLRVAHGDAAPILIKSSHHKSTDLVALGTQGTNAVVQYALGSVARKVLAEAKCDVLAVPASALTS